ncbi:hypothetical protein D5086_013211 [Populus alba]|uniref:Uncharacterized protein n=1 Tax=Populus alba TaxID=43335 RepID=A0ACC4C4B6_POPAL
MASTKVQRIMTQPINLIFRFLQSKARIQIWLFEQKDLRIEGRIIGFDEYMNLVLEDAEEVNIKKKSRKSLGESNGHSWFFKRSLSGTALAIFQNIEILMIWLRKWFRVPGVAFALFFVVCSPSSNKMHDSFRSGMAGYMRKTTCAVGNYKDEGRVQGERSHCAGPGAAVFLDSII